MDKNRRNLLKGAVVSVAATTVAAAAEARPRLERKVYNPGPAPASPLPFSQAVSYGNLPFVAGQGRTSKVISPPTPSLFSMKSIRYSPLPDLRWKRCSKPTSI